MAVVCGGIRVLEPPVGYMGAALAHGAKYSHLSHLPMSLVRRFWENEKVSNIVETEVSSVERDE
jgi:hypothetical protein